MASIFIFLSIVFRAIIIAFCNVSVLGFDIRIRNGSGMIISVITYVFSPAKARFLAQGSIWFRFPFFSAG